MALPALLEDLLAAHGPSGYEQAPAAAWRRHAAAFATVESDVMGSSTARVAGTADGLRVAVVGHVDEIGMIVSHVDDQGYLWFAGVGGWDPQILVGQRVVVTTQAGSIPGVLGRKPIHLLREEDRKKVPELRDLHIDIGARDGDEARAMVRVGDVAVIDAAPLELPNGRCAARSMDNRLGCYVALEVARRVADAGGAPGDVLAAAVVQEEITFAGARTTAFRTEPDVAIVVDVTHATDVPGVQERELGVHHLGSGPVLSRGATLHPAVFELLRAAGEAEGIAFTVEASARATGTDADAIHVTRSGIPSAVVSLPLRYMHSPVETVALDDVEAAVRLITAFCLRLEPGTDLSR
jgi:endoglucanase